VTVPPYLSISNLFCVIHKAPADAQIRFEIDRYGGTVT